MCACVYSEREIVGIAHANSARVPRAPLSYGLASAAAAAKKSGLSDNAAHSRYNKTTSADEWLIVVS